MKKPNLKLTLASILLSITTISCIENETKTQEKNGLKKLEEKVETEVISDSPKITSMTNPESINRLKQFLKKNTKKFIDYGEIQGIRSVGGDYNEDGVLDYIYTVEFYPGGDYIHPSNFFYDSKLDEIFELSIKSPISTLSYIEAKEIVKGKIIGTGELFDAIDGENAAVRSVKAEFNIKESKITFENAFLGKFKKAEKEITKELDKIQQDKMDNADAYNSEAEAE